jgi:hypothetical protein
MNPAVPPPPDAETARVLNDVLEWGGKAAVSLASIWGFVALIAKPFMEWRKRRDGERRRELAVEIHDILKPELERLEKVGLCADRIEMVLQRQSALFSDIDDFLSIAHTNVERLDEMNDLLDAVGFSTDRRVDDEQRAHVAHLLSTLRDRQRARRRGDDPPPEGHR